MPNRWISLGVSALLTLLVGVSARAASVECARVLTALPFEPMAAVRARFQKPSQDSYRGQFAPRDIDASEFAEIQEIGELIRRRFPSEKYVYVGLGRSPVPFAAYLTARGETVYNLPLSGLNGFLGLLKGQFELLSAHFERFLPALNAIGTRKILLMDFVLSGNSLMRGADYVRAYLAGRDSTVEVVPLGFLYGPAKRLRLNPRLRGSDVFKIPLREGALRDQLRWHQFRRYAEFGGYHIGGPIPARETSDHYALMVKDFQRRLGEQERGNIPQ